jgi:RimJ/RimL family protein N-acetyltransferase
VPSRWRYPLGTTQVQVQYRLWCESPCAAIMRRMRGDGMVPALHGNGVILTGHRPEDVAAHLAGEDEETALRFGWWPERSTAESVLSAYRTWAAQWREGGPTRAFAVRDAATGGLVGGCELRLRPGGPGEVSYWTHADQRGKGYARRALSVLCGYAVSIGVAALEAHIAIDNHASRCVAEAAGFTAADTFTEEGELRVRYIRTWPASAEGDEVVG